MLDYADRPLAHETGERNAGALAFAPDGELLSRYDCVHGHFLAIKYAGSPRPIEFAVWLRDPVQRLVSRYHYGKRQGGLAGLTFTEFCEEERFRNTYAKYLWNFDIDRCDFVGITEEYARSVGVFCRRFGQAANAGAAWNANPRKAGTQYDVTPATRRLIERANEEDLAIYARGKRHLARLENRLRC